MDLESLSDDDLLTELRSALEEVPRAHRGPRQRDRLLAGRQAHGDGERRAAWQRVSIAMRELERRYPPESEPLA
jgi:hypothetical protein